MVKIALPNTLIQITLSYLLLRNDAGSPGRFNEKPRRFRRGFLVQCRENRCGSVGLTAQESRYLQLIVLCRGAGLRARPAMIVKLAAARCVK